jgi:hypothetical protein
LGVKKNTRHWIEPLQILEKISQPEGLRAFVQDGVDCGFSRPEIAELFGTYFEDRLAETMALAIAAGAYPGESEFTRRVSAVLLAPQALFKHKGPGPKSLPVDDSYLTCFREAAFAIEGSFHRYVEGDYVSVVPVSAMLREAHTALLEGNLARAFDRVTSVGARVLEGDYLARPTEWLESDPLYSWLLGLERVAHVVSHLEGWPAGRFASWSAKLPVSLTWYVAPSVNTEITRSRREVLQLLAEEHFSENELKRMRRNRRWIGPELLRLLRMPDEDTTPTVIRNAVRTLGAVHFQPAVDDLLGLLMRVGLDNDEDDEGLVEACEEALVEFGSDIKDQVLHHFDLALVNVQRLALARVLISMPNDDDVMDILEHLVDEAEELAHRMSLMDLIAGYRHPRRRPFLKAQLNRAETTGSPELQKHVRQLLKPRRASTRKVSS